MREYTGAGGLLAAIKAGEELEDDEWAKLYDTATPYERRCARLIQDPECAPHGVAGTYTNWGCRCTPCREAANAGRSTRKVNEDFTDTPAPDDGVPTQVRQLQELVKAGQPLTPKGQQVLDDWEAQQVL